MSVCHVRYAFIAFTIFFLLLYFICAIYGRFVVCRDLDISSSALRDEKCNIQKELSLCQDEIICLNKKISRLEVSGALCRYIYSFHTHFRYSVLFLHINTFKFYEMILKFNQLGCVYQF